MGQELVSHLMMYGCLHFQFIKGNSVEATRISGTCTVISPQYLLAYRGWSFVEEEQDLESFNSLGNASLALLDPIDLEWKTKYILTNTSTVYRVPQKIIEMIGGEYFLLICTVMRTVYSYHLAKLAMQ